MKLNALRQIGYELLIEGAIELSIVEANGLRIDTERLQHTKEDLGKKIKTLRTKLSETDVWSMWRRRYGQKSNLTSRDQLAEIFYKELKFKPTEFTSTGKASTEEEALQKIDHPFIPDLLRFLKYEKALGTFLKGIEIEVVDGFLHPVFNLHLARTYRSSSDSPNFQNIPVRDKEISKIIRSLVIPRKNQVIVENDFKGVEVGVSACYHKDTNFISYFTTPGKDMHRDMAAQIYMLKPEEVSKDARYGAKNKFVFPQFYGDYYVACAKNMWEWITKGKLTGPRGIPMMEHLQSKGIRKLGACNPDEDPIEGTFEYHLKEVENDFWNRRFMQYGQWRKDFYRAYLDRGYFDIYTGFRVYGNFNRNSVTNYPVQGSAFHCLLWTLIQVNKTLRKYHMRSLVVGQIHDSLIGDVDIKELGSYLEIVEEVATVRLRKHYEWLIVPLEIEYEITPSDGSWYDKKEVKFKKGVFTHPSDPTKQTCNPIMFVEALNKAAKEPKK